MSNSDTQRLEKIAQAIAQTGLTVNGDVTGEYDVYALDTYIDEVVVLDSMGKEVVNVKVPRPSSNEKD